MKDHPRTVDEIAEDYRARREALLRALTEGKGDDLTGPRNEEKERVRERERERERERCYECKTDLELCVCVCMFLSSSSFSLTFPALFSS